MVRAISEGSCKCSIQPQENITIGVKVKSKFIEKRKTHKMSKRKKYDKVKTIAEFSLRKLITSIIYHYIQYMAEVLVGYCGRPKINSQSFSRKGS